MEASGSNSIGQGTSFKINKRVTPGLVIVSTVTGATGVVRNASTSSDSTIAGITINGDGGFLLACTGGPNAQHDRLAYHWEADAEL